MKVRLSKTLYADVAHQNPLGGAAQQRLHGHSLLIDIIVSGEVESEYGWLLDFGEIRQAFEPACGKLDHSYLNELEGLATPTMDGVRRWILDHLRPQLPCLEDVRITIAGDCAFSPVELPPEPAAGLPSRLRFTFEAAQSLPQLPDGHPCRQMHGHSYGVEAGPADAPGLADALRSIYDELDHRCLNDIAGLGQATCERICEWLWNRLAGAVDGLAVVGCKETRTTQCYFFGE